MKKFLLVSLAVVMLAASDGARADYIQTLGVDENCVALGGACVARAGDLGAYYVNPAGATDFVRPRLGFNGRLLDTRGLDLKDSDGDHSVFRTNTQSDLALAPTLAFYAPVIPDLTAGIGVGAPFAITGYWGQKAGIARYDMSDQALFILDVSPSIAFKIDDKLSIGASVSVTALKHLRTQTLIPDSFAAALPPSLGGAGIVIPTTPTSPIIGSITQNTNHNVDIGLPPGDMQSDFRHAALVLGARYRVTPEFSLGIAGRTTTPNSFDGTTTLALGSMTQSVPFKVRLDLPGHIQTGMSYQLLPGTELSFDYQRTFWADAAGLGSPTIVKFGVPLLGFVNKLQINYQAHDTDTFHFGVSHSILSGITLMAGYARDGKVFGDQSVDILTYDSDRNIYSFGARYDTRGGDETRNGWIFTGSFQLTDYVKRTIGTGVSQNLGGVSLPNLIAPDTLSFSPNRSPFTFGGDITAVSIAVEYVF